MSVSSASVSRFRPVRLISAQHHSAASPHDCFSKCWYRVRGWHCCHRPPLRTVLAVFTAHGSSISNALFGGRGTATVAFCGISLPVQLHMTDWMHHHQIGHRIVTTVHHPDTVMQVPAGFRGDLLSTLWASAILVEPQLQKLIVSAEVLFHLKT